MNRLRSGRGQTFTGIVLMVVVLVVLALFASNKSQDALPDMVRANFDDATPLGGKGLRLLMERLGYSVKRANLRLDAMPPDARVWILLDPGTKFSKTEAASLLAWVRSGNTLVMAVPPEGLGSSFFGEDDGGVDTLCARIGVARPPLFSAISTSQSSGAPLPDLKPLPRGAASVYWEGVSQASASRGQLQFATRTPQDAKDSLEISGNPVGPILVRRTLGRGRVVLAPDALLFCNYALSKPDNAVLVSNLVRYGVPAGSAIYFDERSHGELNGEAAAPDNVLRYLQVPAVRAACAQLFVAGLLLWALVGTRLGRAVPLPESESVTRASNFARAMGALFHQSGRSEASSALLGADFRRLVSRRVGLSQQDAPELIATRVSEAADVPQPLVLRLLLRANTSATATNSSLLEAAPRAMERLTTGSPEARNDADLLRDAQEMEDVLRKLGVRR